MKGFIDKNFLIQNKIAERIYNDFICDLPIIDYHNHLNVMCIAENKSYENITQLWIAEDPYKHRAMRINGIPEKNITGDVSDKEKFLSWAETVHYTLGNPLYHWSHMELKRFFGIDEMLIKHNAEEIWNRCNDHLKEGKLNSVNLINKCNAEVLYTSNDLLETFENHRKINTKDFGFQIYPSLRGDSIVSVNSNKYENWKKSLEKQTSIPVNSLDDYKTALKQKLREFELSDKAALADHALDAGFVFQLPSEKKASDLFHKKLQSESLNDHEIVLLESYLLNFLAKEYGARGWILQLHIGAQRNTSTRLREVAGPTGGYATIGKPFDINSLCKFLDSLEQEGVLPKTIIYNLNPADNEAVASLTGSFTGDGVAGNIQFGPAWWYNDHLKGIENHLTVLANYGLLSQFIGMTTDSRSILSLSRHEYFRRVLSNTLGSWAENGFIPNDLPLLEEISKRIAYENIKNYIVKSI